MLVVEYNLRNPHWYLDKVLLISTYFTILLHTTFANILKKQYNELVIWMGFLSFFKQGYNFNFFAEHDVLIIPLNCYKSLIVV